MGLMLTIWNSLCFSSCHEVNDEYLQFQAIAEDLGTRLSEERSILAIYAVARSLESWTNEPCEGENRIRLSGLASADSTLSLGNIARLWGPFASLFIFSGEKGGGRLGAVGEAGRWADRRNLDEQETSQIQG